MPLGCKCPSSLGLQAVFSPLKTPPFSQAVFPLVRHKRYLLSRFNCYRFSIRWKLVYLKTLKQFKKFWVLLQKHFRCFLFSQTTYLCIKYTALIPYFHNSEMYLQLIFESVLQFVPCSGYDSLTIAIFIKSHVTLLNFIPI